MCMKTYSILRGKVQVLFVRVYLILKWEILMKLRLYNIVALCCM